MMLLMEKEMPRCEDYPCCGHTEPDGSTYCPDDDGRFACVNCGRKLEKNATSSICVRCRRRSASMDPEEREYRDQMQEQYDMQWGR